jgi:hypothetical protein
LIARVAFLFAGGTGGKRACSKKKETNELFSQFVFLLLVKLNNIQIKKCSNFSYV